MATSGFMLGFFVQAKRNDKLIRSKSKNIDTNTIRPFSPFK